MGPAKVIFIHRYVFKKDKKEEENSFFLAACLTSPESALASGDEPSTEGS